MAASRDTLHNLIERLPAAEIHSAQRFLEFLAEESVGPAFAESIRRSLAQADTGETTLCRTYDEMVEKVLDAD